MPALEEITLPHTFQCRQCGKEMEVEPSGIGRPDHTQVKTAFSNFGWKSGDDGPLCNECSPGGAIQCSTCGAQNSSHRTRCSQCHEPL